MSITCGIVLFLYHSKRQQVKAPSPCAELWYTGASGRNVPRFFGCALNYICLLRTFRAFRSYDCQTRNVLGRWKENYRARILEVRQELIAKGYEGNCIQIKERLQHPTTLSVMFLAELAKYCEKRQAEVGVHHTTDSEQISSGAAVSERICRRTLQEKCCNVPTNLRIHISIGMAMSIGR